MAFGFDSGTLKANGSKGDKYVVLQVVLTEKFLGTDSGTASLTNLQAAINEQAEKGYRLHTISTTSSGSKGFLGGDKIQATMVFERIDAFTLDGLYSSQNNLAQNVSAVVSNEKSSADNTTSSNIWVCTKCGESNPMGTILCRKCGK